MAALARADPYAYMRPVPLVQTAQNRAAAAFALQPAPTHASGGGAPTYDCVVTAGDGGAFLIHCNPRTGTVVPPVLASGRLVGHRATCVVDADRDDIEIDCDLA
jgi:hypothetical protein